MTIKKSDHAVDAAKYALKSSPKITVPYSTKEQGAFAEYTMEELKKLIQGIEKPMKKKIPHEVQIKRAEYNRLEKKAKKDARAALTWTARLPHAKAVDWDTIASTLSVENPVAFVTQKEIGVDCAVLIHRSILRKAATLNFTYGHYMQDLYCTTEEHGCIILNRTDMSTVLHWVKEVKALKWNTDAGIATKTVITVRYPEV